MSLPPDPPGSRDRLANLCCGHAACQRETERVATAAYADGYAAGRKDERAEAARMVNPKTPTTKDTGAP